VDRQRRRRGPARLGRGRLPRARQEVAALRRRRRGLPPRPSQGAAPVLRLVVALPGRERPDPLPRDQRRQPHGRVARAARLPASPAPASRRRRALPGPGHDPHREAARRADRRRAAALRRHRPHLRAAPPRAPGLGTPSRPRRVRRRTGHPARGLVGQGQHPPALRRHPRRPLRHPTQRGPGLARGLPRRAQTGHGLRLPARAGLPAGPAVLVGDPADQPRPDRSTDRPPHGHDLAGTVRGHHRRPATPGAALHPLRDPRPLPRPRRVVPRGPRPLGHLGRTMPDPAHRIEGRCDRPAPAQGTDAGPHPRAYPAAARVRRRQRGPPRLGQAPAERCQRHSGGRAIRPGRRHLRTLPPTPPQPLRDPEGLPDLGRNRPHRAGSPRRPAPGRPGEHHHAGRRTRSGPGRSSRPCAIPASGSRNSSNSPSSRCATTPQPRPTRWSRCCTSSRPKPTPNG